MSEPKYSHEVYENIIDRVAAGETLREICRGDGAPNYTTVYRKLQDDADLAQRFARARKSGFDAIAEDTFKIADDGSNDWMASNKPDDPGWRANGENVQRSKLRVWTRLQLLAKWSAGSYSDSTHVKLTGPNNGPVQIDDATAAAKLAAILSAARVRRGDAPDDIADLL